MVSRPLASSSRVGDCSVVSGHEQLTFQCNQNVQYESELSFFCLCIELFDKCSTEMDFTKFLKQSRPSRQFAQSKGNLVAFSFLNK